MWPQGGWYWETEPPARRSEEGRTIGSREAHQTTPGLCPGKKTSKTTPGSLAEHSEVKKVSRHDGAQGGEKNSFSSFTEGKIY